MRVRLWIGPGRGRVHQARPGPDLTRRAGCRGPHGFLSPPGLAAELAEVEVDAAHGRGSSDSLRPAAEAPGCVHWQALTRPPPGRRLSSERRELEDGPEPPGRYL